MEGNKSMVKFQGKICEGIKVEGYFSKSKTVKGWVRNLWEVLKIWGGMRVWLNFLWKYGREYVTENCNPPNKKQVFFSLSSGEYVIEFNFALSHEGVLHREVSCGLNEGDPMEERFCEAVLKPRASKTCRNKQCKGTWKASQWSEVSSIVVIRISD